MKPPIRIMAVLKSTEAQETVIGYTRLLFRLFNPQQIYFVYSAGKAEIPEEIIKKYPVLGEPAGEPPHSRLKKIVDAHFEPSRDCEVKLEVLKGPGVVELLKFSWKHEIDLIVLERESEKQRGSYGLLSEKIARKAPCPVLIIPHHTAKAKPQIKRILVPVDFSENSGLALQSALQFAAAAKIKEISCLHVYHVPMEFERTGKSYEEFSGIMWDFTRLTYDNFINGLDTGKINIKPVFQKGDHPARWIRIYAAANAVDLVVTGNRGKNAALLLGSVSEQLIRELDVPLLLSKRKGIWMNLLKALLNR